MLDKTAGQIAATATAKAHDRVDWSGVTNANWIGFPPKTAIVGGKEIPGWHLPDIKFTFVLLVLPAVIALIAENTGHVKAVAEMTRTDLDPVMGRAIAADGVATMVTSRRRRLADHHVRGEHRRHGGDPDLLHRRVLGGGRGGDRVRLLAQVRRASSRPRRAACSAASRSCCTA